MGRGLGGLQYGTWPEAQREKQEEQTSGLRRMAGTGKLVEKMVKAVSVRPADTQHGFLMACMWVSLALRNYKNGDLGWLVVFWGSAHAGQVLSH